MRLLRLIPAGLVIALYASCGDIDAGGPAAPEQQAGQEYFPLAVGNSWRMVRSGSGVADSLDYTVTGDSKTVVERVTTHSEGFELFVVLTSGSDTLHFKTGDIPQLPYSHTEFIHSTSTLIEAFPDTTSTIPTWTVPLPLAAGDTWIFSSKPVEVEATAVTIEGTYSTPAGDFSNVLEIEANWAPDSSTERTVSRFNAPDVGQVAVHSLMTSDVLGDSLYTVDILRSYSTD